MSNFIFEFIHNCFKTNLRAYDESKRIEFINKATEQVINHINVLSVKDILDITNKMDLENLKNEEMLLFMIYLYEAKERKALQAIEEIQNNIHSIFTKGKFVEKEIYEMIDSYKNKIRKEVD